MTDEHLQELAEELPEYQTSRGNEFRTIPVENRVPLARTLTIARSQVNASNADWDDDAYRRNMRREKERYFYQCGVLGIDQEQAMFIWWGVVHDNPAPIDRHAKDLI